MHGSLPYDRLLCPFAGFGPSRFAVGRPRTHELVLPANRRTTRKILRDHCSAAPGVYGMVDAAGELIYVGKSKRLLHRLLSYCSAHPRRDKAGRILSRAQRILWETAPHEFSALLRELELIVRWRPRFNVQGQPRRRRRTYLCLGRRPAPYLYLCAQPTRREEAVFGPITDNRHARRTARLLNDYFQLRTCTGVEMEFAGQLRLPSGSASNQRICLNRNTTI